MEASGNGESTHSLRDRVSGGRPMLWFLVEGNRLLVASGLLAVTYVLLVTLSVFGPGSVAKISGSDPIFALFSSLVIGIIMGVTLVLTFNQLVMARELGPAGEQRDRMRESMQFRTDVEETIDAETSPAEPAPFLGQLLAATSDIAEALGAALERSSNAPEDVRSYANTVSADADRVETSLEGNEFGTFGVIRSALDFDYSAKIHRGRDLRNRHDQTLSEEARDRFEELLEALEFFGPAREHFKTLYFRWEIIDLTRALVYLSLPALAAVAYTILVFQPADVGGATLGIEHSLLVVSGLFIVGVAPFAVFLSYMLRIVSVAKWTLAIGPFILRETDAE